MLYGDEFNPWRHFYSGAWIPMEILRSELNPAAKLIYAQLCRYSGKDGLCFPNIKSISKETGLSLTGVKNSILELEENKLIKVHRKKGKGSFYKFLWHKILDNKSIIDEEEEDEEPSGQENCPPQEGEQLSCLGEQENCLGGQQSGLGGQQSGSVIDIDKEIYIKRSINSNIDDILNSVAPPATISSTTKSRIGKNGKKKSNRKPLKIGPLIGKDAWVLCNQLLKVWSDKYYEITGEQYILINGRDHVMMSRLADSVYPNDISRKIEIFLEGDDERIKWQVTNLGRSLAVFTKCMPKLAEKKNTLPYLKRYWTVNAPMQRDGKRYVLTEDGKQAWLAPVSTIEEYNSVMQQLFPEFEPIYK